VKTGRTTSLTAPGFSGLMSPKNHRSGSPGAALTGLTASAQETTDTRKAEHDSSSSDPGQENRPLLDENPNSNTPPPTDHGDIGPIWYSFDLVSKTAAGHMK
jgi:hypothetical protein